MSEMATTIVLIGFLVATGVIVPICEVSETIRKVISLRWMIHLGLPSLSAAWSSDACLSCFARMRSARQRDGPCLSRLSY